jgi:hypothetical protein
MVVVGIYRGIREVVRYVMYQERFCGMKVGFVCGFVRCEGWEESKEGRELTPYKQFEE